MTKAPGSRTGRRSRAAKAGLVLGEEWLDAAAVCALLWVSTSAASAAIKQRGASCPSPTGRRPHPAPIRNP